MAFYKEVRISTNNCNNTFQTLLRGGGGETVKIILQIFFIYNLLI